MGIPLDKLKTLDKLLFSENDRLYEATFSIGRKWLSIHHSGGRKIPVDRVAVSSLIWESKEAREESKARDLERWRIERRLAQVKLEFASPELLAEIEQLLNKIERETSKA